MIVAFLLFLFVAALGFMWYRSQNTNTNDGPLKVVFNGDGTITQRPVSGTEYFAYITNADSGGVSDKTKDDPIEFQYYTDKTTRDSIWKGLNPIKNSPEYHECTAPECVRVSVTDKEGMQTMINEVYSDLKVGAKEIRAFLVQKGLHTTAAFVAKYKEYNPHGYYAHAFPESDSSVEQISPMHHRFMFEVLIKGFAEFKNVTVPSDMTSETYTIIEYSDFYDQLYPKSIFNFVMDIMYGRVTLSDTSSGQKIQFTNGENTVELRLGVDYPFAIGILIIALVLIIKEDKTIDSVVYNPPNNPISMKQISNSMRTKMSSLERMTQN